jgi:hypothetical protein
MNLSEPWLLWGLMTLPLLALLARAAARARTNVVANLHLWERVVAGVSPVRRRWLSPAEVLVLAATALGIAGAADPGLGSVGDPDEDARRGQADAPLVQSASIEGAWLFVRPASAVSGRYSLRPVADDKAVSEQLITMSQQGGEMVMSLPDWREDVGPLLLMSPNGTPMLGLWPEPPLAVDNSVLDAATFDALLAALDGVSDGKRDAAAGDRVALLGSEGASDSPRMIFLGAGAGVAGDGVIGSMAAVEPWAELVVDADFAVAAAGSQGLAFEHARAEPLVWVTSPQGNRVIVAIDRERREITVSLDVQVTWSGSAWVPHLISLGVRELAGRDVLDSSRYRLFRLPGRGSEPIISFADGKSDRRAGAAPGVYTDGVVNLPFGDELARVQRLESSPIMQLHVTALGWMLLLPAGLLMFGLAVGDVRRMETARRRSVSTAGGYS